MTVKVSRSYNNRMATLTTVQEFHTSREIADRLGQPWTRVRWILSSRRVPTIGIAGITKLYPDAAIEAVRRELEKIDKQRPGPKPAA